MNKYNHVKTHKRTFLFAWSVCAQLSTSVRKASHHINRNCWNVDEKMDRARFPKMMKLKFSHSHSQPFVHLHAKSAEFIGNIQRTHRHALWRCYKCMQTFVLLPFTFSGSKWFHAGRTNVVIFATIAAAAFNSPPSSSFLCTKLTKTKTNTFFSASFPAHDSWSSSYSVLFAA